VREQFIGCASGQADTASAPRDSKCPERASSAKIEERVEQYAKGAGALGLVIPTLADALVGVSVGAIILSVVLLVRKLRARDAK